MGDGYEAVVDRRCSAEADQVASVVDTVGDRRADAVRVINRRPCRSHRVVGEAVRVAAGVGVGSYYHPGVVDAESLGSSRAGEIQDGEGPLHAQPAVIYASLIHSEADHVAQVVDADRLCADRIGDDEEFEHVSNIVVDVGVIRIAAIRLRTAIADGLSEIVRAEGLIEGLSLSAFPT